MVTNEKLKTHFSHILVPILITLSFHQLPVCCAFYWLRFCGHIQHLASFLNVLFHFCDCSSMFLILPLPLKNKQKLPQKTNKTIENVYRF